MFILSQIKDIKVFGADSPTMRYVHVYMFVYDKLSDEALSNAQTADAKAKHSYVWQLSAAKNNRSYVLRLQKSTGIWVGRLRCRSAFRRDVPAKLLPALIAYYALHGGERLS